MTAPVTANTQVIGVPGGDLTLDSVQTILENSPLLIYAAFIRDLAIKNRIRVSFVLAQMLQESALGTAGIALTAYNPAGMRSSVSGLGTIRPTLKGDFVFFNGWADGIREQIAHSTAPDSVYVKEGRKTIRQIVERWSPASDGNRTEDYISNVVKLMNQWIRGSNTNMKDPSNNITILPLASSPDHGRDGADIRFVTWHRQQGRNSLYDEFKNRLPGNLADCTFELKEDGTINRLLPDLVAPWTNGFWANKPNLNNPVIAQLYKETGGRGGTNPWTITIETAGFVNSPLTEAQLNGAAKIAAYCYFNLGIPCDRTHHVGHGEVGEHPYCPGNLFQFDEIIRRANVIIAKGGNTTLDTKPPMPFDPNPLKLAVGQGMLDRAISERLTLITNEQYYLPDPTQPPGLTKRSFAWAKRDGNIFMIVAIQDQDQAGNLLPTWTTQVWDQVA